ncbi:MAG: hypothetical protein ACK5HR_05430 [Mycoplasmatales bacterium]
MFSKLNIFIEKNISKNLMIISSLLIFFSYILVLLRYYLNISFLYYFIDGYWVFVSTMFLVSLIWYANIKHYWIIFLPFILGFFDELLQYNSNFKIQNSTISTLWTRTFDKNDLMAYIIALSLALIVILSLKIIENSKKK